MGKTAPTPTCTTGNTTEHPAWTAACVTLLPAARDIAAAQLYDSEIALHAAHQSQVDAWITAASDHLHEAVLALTKAEAELTGTNTYSPSAAISNS
jgi:hypothetical protein